MTPPTPGLLVRRRIGDILLALGLLFALVAYNGLVVRAIVIDGDLAERAAATAMRDERMQRVLANATAEAIETQYLGGSIAQLEAAGFVAGEDVQRMADAVVADPAFANAFGAAVRGLHEYVLVEHDTPPVVDATAALGAARDTAVALNPGYAALLPADSTLRVHLPAEGLPDLTGASTALSERAKLAGLTAALLIGAAFAVHSRRPTVIRRLGTWALGIAVIQGIVAVVLPRLAGAVPADIEPVALAVASTLRPRLLAPAAMMGAAGIALVIGAWRWRRSLDATHERYGATAFLASDDDEPFTAPVVVAGPIETATLRSPMGAPPVPRVSRVTDVLPTTSRGA